MRTKLYLFDEGFSNCYILANESENKAVIIDAGVDPTFLLRDGIKQRYRVEGLILTHCHIDHTYFAQTIKEVFDLPVFIHKDEKNLINNAEFNLSYLFFTEKVDFSGLELQSIDEGLLNLAGFNLKILHTPGHTKGSICIQEEEIIFSGDTIFKSGIGRTDFPGGDYNTLIKSIKEKILKLDFCNLSQKKNYKIYPGHGLSTTIEEEKNFLSML